MKKSKIEVQTKEEWNRHADEIGLLRTLLINQISTRTAFECQKETALLTKALEKIDEYRSRMESRMAFQGVVDVNWYPAHVLSTGHDVSGTKPADVLKMMEERR